MHATQSISSVIQYNYLLTVTNTTYLEGKLRRLSWQTLPLQTASHHRLGMSSAEIQNVQLISLWSTVSEWGIHGD